jgi:large subunit ribosomal protein L30
VSAQTAPELGRRLQQYAIPLKSIADASKLTYPPSALFPRHSSIRHRCTRPPTLDAYLHHRRSARTMSYFRITLMRSGIGMPAKTQGVLKALGLRKRMTTKYYPVTPSVAGQIMRIKELVDVKEVKHAMTDAEMRASRRPASGYYIETRAAEAMKGYE